MNTGLLQEGGFGKRKEANSPKQSFIHVNPFVEFCLADHTYTSVQHDSKQYPNKSEVYCI